MSVRLRIYANNLTAMLVFNAASMAMGFVLFWIAGETYVGERLAMTTSVTHDLQTTITSICGYALLLAGAACHML